MNAIWNQLRPCEVAIKAIQETERQAKVGWTLAIGEKLHEAYAILANHGDGTWSEWCETRIAIKRQRATEYRNAFLTFGDCPECGQTFDKSALIDLSKPSMPTELIATAKQMARLGKRVTHKWVRQALANSARPQSAAKPHNPRSAILRAVASKIDQCSLSVQRYLATEEGASKLETLLESFILEHEPQAIRLDAAEQKYQDAIKDVVDDRESENLRQLHLRANKVPEVPRSLLMIAEMKHCETYGWGSSVRSAHTTTIYFSGTNAGDEYGALPEEVLGKHANVMLSYWDVDGKEKHRDVSEVRSHFLDSGAFSISNKPIDWQLAYRDRYAAFIKSNALRIDLYANLDKIGDAQTTWENQQYLEKEHGLTPVPVVHCGESLDWLTRYIHQGYPLIALGGLVGAKKEVRKQWLDRCFTMVCDTPDRKPCVRLHGFGITSISMLVRYPWASVDSTSWLKLAGTGDLIVPSLVDRNFRFQHRYHRVAVSDKSSRRRLPRRHLLLRHDPALDEWLDFTHSTMGKGTTAEITTANRTGDYGDLVCGVANDYRKRRRANLIYFKMLEECLSYPRWFDLRRSQIA